MKNEPKFTLLLYLDTHPRLERMRRPDSGPHCNLGPKTNRHPHPYPKPSRTPEPTETFKLEPTITETYIPWPTSDWDKACGTVTIGKPGTQSQDKTHPVLVQGTAILCDEIVDFYNGYGYETPVEPFSVAALDLDTGSNGLNRADLEFMAGWIRGDRMYPFHYVGAMGHAFGVGWSPIDNGAPPEPTFDECQTLDEKFRADNPQKYVCVITDAGHVARVKVEDYAPINEWGSIKISFITWNVVAPTPTPYGGK